MPRSYRFSGAFVVSLMGLALLATGVLVLVLVGVVALFSLPDAVLGAAVSVLVVAVLAGGLLARRRAVVVRLDETGYRVRFVRGVGVPAAPWRLVEDATTTWVRGQRCVVLRLRDGRTTTVPVGLLAGSPERFVEDLQAHLDRGHGYRPAAGGGG